MRLKSIGTSGHLLGSKYIVPIGSECKCTDRTRAYRWIASSVKTCRPPSLSKSTCVRPSVKNKGYDYGVHSSGRNALALSVSARPPLWHLDKTHDTFLQLYTTGPRNVGTSEQCPPSCSAANLAALHRSPTTTGSPQRVAQRTQRTMQSRQG